MRSIIAITVVVALTLGVGSACLAAPPGTKTGSTTHKQYRWKDSAGSLHYSDVLTMDALQSGYDVIGDNGVVTKHVDRARTEEERNAAEAVAATEAAAKQDTERRAEVDRRLLAAYPTEGDLVRARQMQVDSIEQSIVGATNSLHSQEQALTDNLAHAAVLERSNKSVPDNQKKQIETLRKSVESLRGYVERRQKEKIEAAKRLETDVAHYREARERSNSGQL